MAYDVTTFDKALKILYPRGLSYAFFRRSNFLKWLKKTTNNFGGKHREITIVPEGTWGSATFATAQSNAGQANLQTFQVTRKKDYHMGFLDLEALAASKGDRNALATTVNVAMKSAMNGCELATLHQVWGNGGGARGQISTGSVVTTDTITLADPADIIHFGVGMVLQASTADGLSGAVRAGTVTVESVDRAAGTITVEEASWDDAAGIPAVATSDYLFRSGDFGLVANGVQSWIPFTAAALTANPTLFGVTRTVDATRLAGLRIDVSGATTEEGVIDGLAQGSIEGSSFDTCWVNPLRFAELQKGVQSKTYFEATVELEPGVSISGLKFHSEHGDVTVMCDRGCPKNFGLLTNRDAWELASVKEWPHLMTEHGLRYIPSDTADQLEFRLKRYGNLLCLRPLDCGALQFA